MLTQKLETELLERARQNYLRSHAPDSEHKFGVALLGEHGIYDGSNTETDVIAHAEKIALDQALLAGEQSFIAMAVATDDSYVHFPCGRCLQDLRRYNDGSLEIMATNLEGHVRKYSLAELLPIIFPPNYDRKN